MNKLLLVAVLLLGFSAMAVAQDTPVAEIFAGYSYVRPDTGQDESLNMHGWNTSVSINGSKLVGMVADFGGTYGTLSDNAGDANIHIHSMLFGPKIAARKGKVTPFVQGLFGFARLSGKSNSGTGAEEIFLGETDFAMAFGGGIDINLSDKVAIRPAQAEWFIIRSAGEMLDNFRYSAGIVFKLGKR
jgi:opacity protein-like surface antigen